MNDWLDRLPRTHFGRSSREVSAFLVCGMVGYYVAVLATLTGGMLTGRSLLVLAVLSVVAAASFFGYVYVRRWITGRETMVQLDQVWFAMLCMAATLWAFHEPILPYLDVVSVGVCMFLAGGRVGCLLVGCCHGRPSTFGIAYPQEHAREGFPLHLVGVRLFPLAAVEAVGLVCIGLIGLAALPFAAPGRVFLWFLLAYAVLRFGLEGLRGDSRPQWLGLSRPRWMSLMQLAFVLWLGGGGRISTQDALLGDLLLLALAVALAVRRVIDPRRQLLAGTHLQELQDIIRSEGSSALRDGRDASVPPLRVSSRGVAVAVSRAAREEGDVLHASFSQPSDPHDLVVLCELAARVAPQLVPESAQFTGGTVLHVLTPLPRGATPDAPGLLPAVLYGNVVRQLQAEAEVGPDGSSTSAANILPAVTGRARYFGPAGTFAPGNR